jgi:hypothetical protein
MEITSQNVLTDEAIILKIYSIRDQKVMLDNDLASLYGVGTRDMNKAVKRNLKRFPDDFMFQLTKDETSDLMFQNGTSSWGGRRKLPYAFTEQGIAMLSSVLNSDLAIQMNIRIIRIFIRMRNLIETDQEILFRLRLLEQNDTIQDKEIMIILDYIKSMEIKEYQEKSIQERKRIGFIIRENNGEHED